MRMRKPGVSYSFNGMKVTVKIGVNLCPGNIRLLESLLKFQVRFILVGGHAAIYHGVNRNTGDLDILIEPTAENGKRLVLALRNSGLEVPELLPEEFEKQLRFPSVSSRKR
jgi:hypothetical protein